MKQKYTYIIRHCGRNIEYRKEYDKLYYRTPMGRISQIVHHQKTNSKRRGHPIPPWTSKELYVYAMNNKQFLDLFRNWILSGYSKKLAPSLDRIDNDLPYLWNNIQWVTSYYNCHIKGLKERLSKRWPSSNSLCQK